MRRIFLKRILRFLKVLILEGFDTKELQHRNISIVSLRENLDFTSPTGKMVATVLASVATLERAIISERIRQSLMARKLAAERTGSGWRCGRKPIAKEIVDQVTVLRC